MNRTLGYRPGLDGVRAVAIGLVLLNHTGLSIFLGGGNGVIVFFVLSGFLITKLMLEEWDRSGTISVGGFYGRRAVRILPAPTVMLVVLLAASWAITETPSEHSYLLKEILLSATYLTNMKPLLLRPKDLKKKLPLLRRGGLRTRQRRLDSRQRLRSRDLLRKLLQLRKRELRKKQRESDLTLQELKRKRKDSMRKLQD